MLASTIRIIVLTGLLALTGCASTGPAAPVSFTDGMMVNTAGMTLYTFDKDPVGSGKSVCNGPCANNWPPLRAGASDQGGGEFTVVKRDDGSAQWAYKGKPLYTWIKDAKPGDKTGDNFNNVWHVVKQ